jgi:hypothetical protein
MPSHAPPHALQAEAALGPRQTRAQTAAAAKSTPAAATLKAPAAKHTPAAPTVKQSTQDQMATLHQVIEALLSVLRHF